MRLTDQRVHLIGIGGAGMSAIAKVLLERGTQVSGSDLKPSRTATVLQAMGAVVSLGHDASHIEGATVVIRSSAIPDENVELRAALQAGIPVLSRGEALASILEDRRSVVVAGTHGKTTTTSMIVSIVAAAGLDPTYLVGGGLNDAGTNARAGSGDIAIAESDESDGSFLLLAPTIAVITNVEMDHVDHWGTFDELTSAFTRFMEATDPGGALIVPAGRELERTARSLDTPVVTFGDGGDFSAVEIANEQQATSFTLKTASGEAPVLLQALGAHNISNALAAAAAAASVGVTLTDIAAGLGTFTGVERRFDVLGSSGGVTVIDDYAHHPTEVAATLSAARTGPWERVVAVFQPHRYSRTAALHEAFGDSFSDADHIVVTDVYGAGEDPVPGVSGKLISDSICESLPGRSVAYVPHRAEVLPYLRGVARGGDVVITLGAGDVNSIGEELLKDLDGRV